VAEKKGEGKGLGRGFNQKPQFRGRRERTRGKRDGRATILWGNARQEKGTCDGRRLLKAEDTEGLDYVMKKGKGSRNFSKEVPLPREKKG